MSALEFVRISADGTHIIVRDQHGTESELPMDDRVAAALIPRSSPAAGPDALSPREIQARIRAGADVNTLADTTGTPLSRIMAFAVPILQERAHIASRARATLVRRASGVGTLDDIVITRLQPLGVTAAELHWDARRQDDGRWEVKLTYDTNEGGRVATWVFDNKAAVVAPNDDEAHWLLGEPPAAAVRVRETLTKPTIPVFQRTDEPAPAPDNVVSITRVREERATEPPIEPEDVGFEPDVPPVDEMEPETPTVFDDTEPSPAPTPSKKSGRKSIPSWDEILFGSPSDDE